MNCMSKKALLVPVSIKEISMEYLNVEIKLNNTLNKSQLEFDYVIQKDKLLLIW